MHWSHPGEKKLTGGQNWQNKTMSTTQWSPAPMAPQPMPVQHVVSRPAARREVAHTQKLFARLGAARASQLASDAFAPLPVCLFLPFKLSLGDLTNCLLTRTGTSTEKGR